MADGCNVGEMEKLRYLCNSLASIDKIWGTMTRIGPLDAIGRRNFHSAQNQDGGRPLPEVVIPPYVVWEGYRDTDGQVHYRMQKLH